jgi:hypothetical protein
MCPVLQRTEIFEYAKVLGNSQYVLVPFQPYKLLYAYMLAEAGKLSEASRFIFNFIHVSVEIVTIYVEMSLHF